MLYPFCGRFRPRPAVLNPLLAAPPDRFLPIPFFSSSMSSPPAMNSRTEATHRKRKNIPLSTYSSSVHHNPSSKARRLKFEWGQQRVLAEVLPLPAWLLLWAVYLLIFTMYQMGVSITATSSNRNTPSSSSARERHMPSLRSLPVHLQDLRVGDFSRRLDNLSLEIFSAPKPFVEEDAVNNKRAIRSWLRLHPRPRITLLGHEVGYDEAAAEFGLNVEPRVDKTFLGVPLFNAMFERANASQATVAVIVNGDILLFDDFIQTLRRVMTTFEDFLLVSARYDIDALPMRYAEGHAEYVNSVRRHVHATGALHTYGGMDVWAWNTNGPRLFNPVMPHFVFGRGKYDNWLTHETIEAGWRQVVDVSETCMTVHVRHGYRNVEGGDRSNASLSEGFWSKGKQSKFELYINIYLSLHAGTYTNQRGSVLFTPWKLTGCIGGDGMCLVKRIRPGICNCEFSSFARATQSDPIVKPGTTVVRCGTVSEERSEKFKIPVRLKKDKDGMEVSEPTAFGLPLTLTAVLQSVAVNGTVLLTAVNYGYRGFLMNWVCNMRQLNVSNVVVAALDEELYKYAWTRGVATYYENTVFRGVNRSEVGEGGEVYGSDGFKWLTKLKSRVVVRVLKRGYDVLWSDCDIVYFRNPFADLWSHDVDIAIQSNAPDDERPNGMRRINSGFYLARSNKRTVGAFQEIIKVAAKSRMSEQPCFYDVLCGKEGENRVGNDGCLYGKGVSVRLLERSKYANGVTEGMWNCSDGVIVKRWPGLYVLHNNWVKGSEKMERLRRHGFDSFDEGTELCKYSLPVTTER